MLLRAHTIGWQVIAGSVLLMIWGAMGYTASFLLPPAMHTSLLLDVMAIVIFLATGGILALAGWYYAWLAAALPRQPAQGEAEQQCSGRDIPDAPTAQIGYNSTNRRRNDEKEPACI